MPYLSTEWKISPQFMRVDNVKINGDVSNTRKHDISLTVTAFALEDN